MLGKMFGSTGVLAIANPLPVSVVGSVQVESVQYKLLEKEYLIPAVPLSGGTLGVIGVVAGDIPANCKGLFYQYQPIGTEKAYVRFDTVIPTPINGKHVGNEGFDEAPTLDAVVGFRISGAVGGRLKVMYKYV